MHAQSYMGSNSLSPSKLRYPTLDHSVWTAGLQVLNSCTGHTRTMTGRRSREVCKTALYHWLCTGMRGLTSSSVSTRSDLVTAARLSGRDGDVVARAIPLCGWCCKSGVQLSDVDASISLQAAPDALEVLFTIRAADDSRPRRKTPAMTFALCTGLCRN